MLCAEMRNSKELLPLTDFYDTPESFATTGQPGDLIRSMKFDGYNLPEGVEATRILYGTTTSQGDLVTCSGVVLVPSCKASAEGFPVIAWGHVTTGINRRCAPSLMTDRFYDYKVINIFLERGYAVVASDYAGLGTNYPHDYLDKISNGWDIINSVKAARQSVPAVGRKWVAVGVAAGAHAVRGVTQLQTDINDPSYLGAVAVSGLGDARTPMVVLSQEAPFLAIYISEAVKARYPDFNHADILTVKGFEILEMVKTNCKMGSGATMQTGPQLKGSDILNENWEKNPYIDEYFKLDDSEQERYRGPILVIEEENGPSPIIANDITAAKHMRDQGVEVQLKIIPGTTHQTVLAASIDDQLKWIADRFAGRKIATNCESILKLSK
jgi:acetyl esterase/lipase